MQFRMVLGNAATLCLLVFTSASVIAEVRKGGDVVIATDESIDDDVYIFAQKATVDGTIKGDLIVFAQQIIINGSVEGDLIAAGQQLVVNGKVSDDARIAGQVLTFHNDANIGDDLIAAGFSLECTESSRIGGEVKFAGYQSIFAGRVDKTVNFTSAKSKISGSFGDDIETVVEGGNYGPAGFWGSEFPDVPPGLTITESADITGDLTYRSSREANIDPESRIAGAVEYSKLESTEDQPPTIKERAISSVQQFFAVLLVGVLVVFLCPKWTGRVVNNLQYRPLASVGWGVLTLIAVFATAILLLVATIAIAVLLGFVTLNNLIPVVVWLGLLSIAVVLVGFWIFSAWVAKVVVCVWAGNRAINGTDWIAKRRFPALALGALFICVLFLIPVAGSVVGIVVMLAGIGSTTIWFFKIPESAATGKPRPQELRAQQSKR